MLDFDHIWQGALTLFGILFGWLHHQRNQEIDEMKQATKRAQETAQDALKSLAAHQLYAAETFATTSEVSGAIDKAEERLGSQIKQNHEHMLQRLDDIRDRLPRRN